jgi:hypothetical protein
MSSTKHYRIMVAVETDATRYYGPDAARPALLGGSDCEQLLAHLAADLKNLFPEISRCSVVAPGALFDQTQILRPGYPAFSALEAASVAQRAEEFRPGLASIASTGGIMPVEELQPLDDIPLGLLQLLPIVVHGPADDIDELGREMEYRFMEEGQLSAHSANWLQTAFGITIHHGRFMTLTDLNAMLRMQLEHFGFLPMWELIDQALNDMDTGRSITTDSGKVLEWRDGAVHAVFETFDYWANEGGGRGAAASRQILAEQYGDWTREMRQYLTTLGAHGIELKFHLPEAPEKPLDGSFLIDISPVPPPDDAATVTEHSYTELGTIAVSLVRSGQQVNYYPIQPLGLNDIHNTVRDQVPHGHTVAYPGTILYDESSRRLVPESR